jgi:hypothetical protein
VSHRAPRTLPREAKAQLETLDACMCMPGAPAASPERSTSRWSRCVRSYGGVGAQKHVSCIVHAAHLLRPHFSSTPLGRSRCSPQATAASCWGGVPRGPCSSDMIAPSRPRGTGTKASLQAMQRWHESPRQGFLHPCELIALTSAGAVALMPPPAFPAPQRMARALTSAGAPTRASPF